MINMFKRLSCDLINRIKTSSIKKRSGRNPLNLQPKKSKIYIYNNHTLSIFRWNRKLNNKFICFYSTDYNQRVNEDFPFKPPKVKKRRKRIVERILTTFHPTTIITMFFGFLILSVVGYFYFTIEPKERILGFIAETIYRSVLDSQESLNIAEIEDFQPTYTLRTLQREFNEHSFFLTMLSYLYKIRRYISDRPASQIGAFGEDYLIHQPAIAMTVNIPLKTGGFLKLTYDIFYNDQVYTIGSGVYGKMSPFEHQVLELYKKVRDLSYEMEPLPKSAPEPYMKVFYKNSYTSDRDNIELNRMFEEKF